MERAHSRIFQQANELAQLVRVVPAHIQGEFVVIFPRMREMQDYAKLHWGVLTETQISLMYDTFWGYWPVLKQNLLASMVREQFTPRPITRR